MKIFFLWICLILLTFLINSFPYFLPIFFRTFLTSLETGFLLSLISLAACINIFYGDLFKNFLFPKRILGWSILVISLYIFSICYLTNYLLLSLLTFIVGNTLYIYKFYSNSFIIKNYKDNKKYKGILLFFLLLSLGIYIYGESINLIGFNTVFISTSFTLFCLGLLSKFFPPIQINTYERIQRIPKTLFLVFLLYGFSFGIDYLVYILFLNELLGIRILVLFIALEKIITGFIAYMFRLYNNKWDLRKYLYYAFILSFIGLLGISYTSDIIGILGFRLVYAIGYGIIVFLLHGGINTLVERRISKDYKNTMDLGYFFGGFISLCIFGWITGIYGYTLPFIIASVSIFIAFIFVSILEFRP